MSQRIHVKCIDPSDTGLGSEVINKIVGVERDKYEPNLFNIVEAPTEVGYVKDCVIEDTWIDSGKFSIVSNPNQPKFQKGDVCQIVDKPYGPYWYNSLEWANQLVTITDVLSYDSADDEFNYRIEEFAGGVVGEKDLTLVTCKPEEHSESETRVHGLSYDEWETIKDTMDSHVHTGETYPEKEIRVIFNPNQIQDVALWLELNAKFRMEYEELSQAIYDDIKEISDTSALDAIARLGYRIIVENIHDSDDMRVDRYEVLLDMNVAENTNYLEGTFDSKGDLVVKFPSDL